MKRRAAYEVEDGLRGNVLASPHERETSARGVTAYGRAVIQMRVPLSWTLIGMLFATLAAIPFARDVDNDFWWHLRTGQLIVAGGIPRHDPFSWTEAGKPWVAHEWLSEVIIYAVQSALGYAGNMLLFIAVALASIAVSCALARRLGTGATALILLLVVAALTFAIFITPRPQVFTWLFFAVYLFILARPEAATPAQLWVLPILMLFWVNLHLGFYFGLMLVACWMAAQGFEAIRGRPVRLRQSLAVGAACVAATFANPAGPSLLVYPLRYVFDAQVVNSSVSEWQRPDVTWTQHWSIYLTAVLLGLAIISPGRPRPFLLLVAIAVIALSMQAVRNAPLAALVLLPVAGPAFYRTPSADRPRSQETEIPVGAAAVMIAAVALIVGPIALSVAGRGVALGAPGEDGYPAGAAAYARQHLAGRRVFNSYNDGGYLIYKLYPNVPVFIDGRTDFYGDGLLRDYLLIGRAEPGWSELLDRYTVDAVMIGNGAPLAPALAADPAWELRFADATDVVYVKR